MGITWIYRCYTSGTLLCHLSVTSDLPLLHPCSTADAPLANLWATYASPPMHLRITSVYVSFTLFHSCFTFDLLVFRLHATPH